MGLFGTKKVAEKETTIQDCVRMIESFLKKGKMTPSDHRLPDPDTLGWWLQRGSARIYIVLNQQDNTNTVRVFSPNLYLPNDHVLPFYRRCLEMNMSLLQCAFAATEDTIGLVSERPIKGLDEHELENLLLYLSRVADDVDNVLANEFQAKLYLEGQR
jgi:hypothetical protein